MNINNSKLRKLVWTDRIKQWWAVPAVISVVLLFYLFVILATNPVDVEYLEGVVVSAGSIHGIDGSGVYLSCKLESGELVKVFLNNANAGPVRKGKAVTLKKTIREFGGYKYKLVKYVN